MFALPARPPGGNAVCVPIVALSAIAATGGGACRLGHAPRTPALAREITTPQLLVRGPARTGEIGDLRLQNGLIAGVITRGTAHGGFAASSGNLVDLAAVGDDNDHLNEVFLYLNDEFPRQAQYDDVAIVDRGGGRRSAVIRARGRDTHDPRIEIATDYILAPDQPWITLETRFTSTATFTIEGYEIGDAVQWGRTEHMAPGHGFNLPGRRMQVDWVSGIGRGVSYAIVPDGPRQFDCISGSMWSDPIGETVDLYPGKSVVYRRHVVVGRGDTASLAPAVSRLRRDATGQLNGIVLSSGVGVGQARVLVETSDAGQLVGVAETDDEGRFSIMLPPRTYRLRAEAAGRAPVKLAMARVQPNQTKVVSFTMARQARLAWRIRDEDGGPIAVRVGVHGVDGTENPRFGPSFRAQGAENFIFSQSGDGAIPLSPGRYRIVASKGLEYELVDETVTVSEGETTRVDAVLARAFTTEGFIGADLHQHAAPSFDSGVSLEDRVLSNAAEGVEVLVASDHNVLTDYAPVIARMGLGDQVRAVVGVEATTHSVGHFNVLPLAPKPSAPRGGMVDPEGWSPDQMLDFARGLAAPGIVPFVQVNHPRSGGTGYFSIMKLDKQGRSADPRYSARFDGVEVVSLGYADETRQAREDWFALLRRGRRITATGTSDSHTLTRRPPGWPRTLVCVDGDTPRNLNIKAFTEALRQGCVTISAGPVVMIRAGTTRMGGVHGAKKGRFRVDVDVRAASWIGTDLLTIYIDGRKAKTIRLSTSPKGSPRPVKRWSGAVALDCKADCFVVAEVTSASSLEPVVKTRPRMKPKPIGLTNPIYVDVDGDGAYRPKN